MTLETSLPDLHVDGMGETLRYIQLIYKFGGCFVARFTQINMRVLPWQMLPYFERRGARTLESFLVRYHRDHGCF